MFALGDNKKFNVDIIFYIWRQLILKKLKIPNGKP